MKKAPILPKKKTMKRKKGFSDSDSSSSETDSSRGPNANDRKVEDGWLGSEDRHEKFFLETYGGLKEPLSLEVVITKGKSDVKAQADVVSFVKDHKGKVRFASMRFQPGVEGAKSWNRGLNDAPKKSAVFHFCGKRTCGAMHPSRPTFHVRHWRVVDLAGDKGKLGEVEAGVDGGPRDALVGAEGSIKASLLLRTDDELRALLSAAKARIAGARPEPLEDAVDGTATPGAGAGAAGKLEPPPFPPRPPVSGGGRVGG